MAKLTTAQLNAVITTIRNTVSENNEKKRIEFEKTLNKDKEYKDLIQKFEQLKKIEEQEKELAEKNTQISKEIHAIIEKSSNRYFYSSDYSCNRKEYLIQKYISDKFEIKDSYDYEKIKTEILIASIDPTFNIQQFIDKYSNI